MGRFQLFRLGRPPSLSFGDATYTGQLIPDAFYMGRSDGISKERGVENRSADSTQLAVDRTRMAHDRTLMAWVRTATSLISFGFAIDKFFEGRPREHAILGARNFSLVMISIGLATLILAAIQ